MKIQKRYLFGLFCLMLFIFTACSNGAKTTNEPADGDEDQVTNETPSEEPVTINFVLASTHDTKPFEYIFEKFHEETGHTVQIQPLPGADYDNMMKTRFGTGDYPDIFLMQPGTKQNVKFRAEEELYEWSNETVIMDRLLDSAKEFQTTKDNKIYGIPWGSTGSMGILYNKKIFEEVGVQPPENYNDLLDIAAKVKEAGYIPFYEAVSDAWPAQIFNLTGWTSFVDPAIGDEGVAKLDSNELRLTDIPELKELFQKQLDLQERGFYQENLLAGTYDDQQEQFGSGKVAMIFQLSGIFPLLSEKFGPEFLEENVGYFPFPSETDKGIAMVTQPDQLMVPKKTEHMDVAIQLVEFMTSKEMLDYWYSAQPGIPIYQDTESELYPAQEDVLVFIEAGKSKVNIQNRLTATFVDFDKTLQNMFIEGDVDQALKSMDENYRRDGESKRLPGFVD